MSETTQNNAKLVFDNLFSTPLRWPPCSDQTFVQLYIKNTNQWLAVEATLQPAANYNRYLVSSVMLCFVAQKLTEEKQVHKIPPRVAFVANEWRHGIIYRFIHPANNPTRNRTDSLSFSIGVVFPTLMDYSILLSWFQIENSISATQLITIVNFIVLI